MINKTKRDFFYIKKKYLKDYDKFNKQIKENKMNKSELICSLISKYVEDME